jgi:hypothetical protein
LEWDRCSKYFLCLASKSCTTLESTKWKCQFQWRIQKWSSYGWSKSADSTVRRLADWRVSFWRFIFWRNEAVVIAAKSIQS